MKLIVGLGNPGEKYLSNRHNVGFRVLDLLSTKFADSSWEKSDKFAASVNFTSSDYILAKPKTFMNNSGSSVKNILNYYKTKITDLWIVHDDLDIKLGQYKIQKGRGPKLHYGVKSIEESLGKTDFWRVRIGVDNREPESRILGEDYVLQNFTKEEDLVLDKVVKEVCEELLKWTDQK